MFLNLWVSFISCAKFLAIISSIIFPPFSLFIFWNSRYMKLDFFTLSHLSLMLFYIFHIYLCVLTGYFLFPVSLFSYWQLFFFPLMLTSPSCIHTVLLGLFSFFSSTYFRSPVRASLLSLTTFFNLKIFLFALILQDHFAGCTQF